MKFTGLWLFTVILLTHPILLYADETPRKREESRLNKVKQDGLIEHIRAALGTANLASISDLFTKSKDVEVLQNRSGNIRILVGKVTNALLETKIGNVTFKPSERYNPQEAITPIMQSEQFQKKLRELVIEVPLTFDTGRSLDPDPSLPHLPSTMKNFTLSEALDRVGQTFNGVIIYGEWTIGRTRFFSVDFAPIAAFDKGGLRER